jgi:hypothetical protein
MIEKVINLDGVSFTLAHVLSFENEKYFIDFSKEQVYLHLTPDQQKKNLKAVFQIAKKMAKAQEKTEVLTNENPD